MCCCSALTTRRAIWNFSSSRQAARGARRRSGCARARTACASRSARCSRSRARRRRPSPSAASRRARPGAPSRARAATSPRLERRGSRPPVEQQLRAVVGEVAVDRALAQPLEPLVGAAVDAPAVDQARDRVELLARRRRRCRCPGAAGVREKSIAPKSLRNASSGSCASKAIGARSPPTSSRSPIVWSMNCPQTKPHCVTPFSENRFCDVVGEDAVADVARRRPGDGLADAVRVDGRRDAQSTACRPGPTRDARRCCRRRRARARRARPRHHRPALRRHGSARP